MEVVTRPWGEFHLYARNAPCTVKALYIKSGEALSLQYHNHRRQRYIIVDPLYIEWSDEPVPDGMSNTEAREWFVGHCDHKYAARGDEFFFDERVIHRAMNLNAVPAMFFEVAFGENDEADIVRLLDRYGRES